MINEVTFSYHNGFEHFSGYGRQNPFIVILTEYCVNFGKLVRNRPEENSQGDVDVLQICNDNENKYISDINVTTETKDGK